MKPDWKDAPKKAKYLAQDADGEWFWYQDKPEPVGTAWYAPGMSWKCIEEPKDFKKTLESRP